MSTCFTVNGRERRRGRGDAGRCCREALLWGGPWGPAVDCTWRQIGHWERTYDLGIKEQFAKFCFKEHNHFNAYLESIQEYIIHFCIH